jgi:hypothetical protein
MLQAIQQTKDQEGRQGMGPKFRKLEVKDLRDVEKLVTENAESIEPGLKIIDSCILLGHARIDLVGVDAKDTLVLTTLGFAANEEMLMRALEAYSFCLEFPETVRRLYPRSRFKPGRPPRVLFIAERMSDGFLRKVRQLNFPQLDCLTFLHLEVNGAPAVYFETIEKIRRPFEEQPEMEQSPIIPDLPMDQHPFLDGTPPDQPWDDPDGNAAWQARLTGQQAEEAPPTAARPSYDAWPEPVPTAGVDPLGSVLLSKVPDGALSLEEALPTNGNAAGRGDNLEQYKGEWREFLDRLGASQLPQSGKLPRSSQEIANQFGPSE